MSQEKIVATTLATTFALVWDSDMMGIITPHTRTAAGGEAAVPEPPSPEHHVLVATTAQADTASRTVVGLLGLAPTQSMDAAGHVEEGGGRGERPAGFVQ